MAAHGLVEDKVGGFWFKAAGGTYGYRCMHMAAWHHENSHQAHPASPTPAASTDRPRHPKRFLATAVVGMAPSGPTTQSAPCPQWPRCMGDNPAC